jgi:ASC-1-like (ASCH) protein
MNHIAILQKQWLPLIVSGEKTIESRWYKTKRTPYGNIKANDTIYFKESGKPVTVKAIVEKVLFFDLRHKQVSEVIKEYGNQIGLKERNPKNYEGLNYCILVFLKEVKQIEPFNIDKTGYGNMSAWITLEDINKIRIPKIL